MSAAAEPAFSKRSIVALVVLLGACFAASAIGGALTRPNLDWYATLVKPGFTPPNGVFPIAWAFLHVTVGIAAWLVWLAPGKDEDKKLAFIWLGILLVAAVLWPAAFFWLHSPALGFGVIVVFLVTIIITIVMFSRLSRAAALLMLPLLLWVSFAMGLNFVIWALNSGYDFSQTPS
jgi:benzodiazapine receptor